MSAPTILYVITDLKLGGVPLHLSRMAKAMQSRGYRVVVASLAPMAIVSDMLKEQGIATHACDGCCGVDYRVIPRLGEIMEEVSPDLIHSLLFHANQAVRLAAALRGFPKENVICELQTVEVERRWHLWVDRYAHRFCRLTIGNSPSVIEHLHQKARIPLDRLQLVRGGVDVERINRAAPVERSSLGIGPRDRILLWVGRLDPVKGLDHLLRAVQAVVSQMPAHLLLVGDGPEKNRLVELVRALRLESHVYFLGPRLDVPSLLKVADAFVFPSRTEGLPNALLEAMAAGAPIVATNVAGCRDLIVHQRSGLLVPYGDTGALGAAVIRLLSDASVARRLGADARAQVAAEWNIESTWDAYAALYQAALGRRP